MGYIDYDDSEMHDLFHRPFTKQCWQQYGGPKLHLKYWWYYKKYNELRGKLCWLLGHDGVHYWQGTMDFAHEEPAGYMCEFCLKELPNVGN